MRETVIDIVEDINADSEYNIDVMFYSVDGDELIQLFDRFETDEDGVTEKFIRELHAPNDAELETAIEDSIRLIIQHAESQGFDADDEHETAGELS